MVFSGHDHVYERVKPQKGISYFVSGAAGQLRRGNMRPDQDTAAYFDQDQSFMLVEVREQRHVLRGDITDRQDRRFRSDSASGEGGADREGVERSRKGQPRTPGRNGIE